MLEVFTTGGGEYLVNTLNAVAAWSGGGGYRSMLQVVMVMGLIYALTMVAFNLDYRAWFQWFLQATLIYMVLMVPTTSVKVTDRINPSLAPATVARVPIGLAVMASFSSQAGDWMTRQAETVFVMPNALALNTNGIVYGARLYEQARSIQVADPIYRANLDEYMKQCVFYDVLLGFKSMDTIMRSDDLWAAIGPGSPARAIKYVEHSGEGTTDYVIPCRTAYGQLNAAFNSSAEMTFEVNGRRLFPDMASSLAKQKLKTDWPTAQNFMHGTSSTDALRAMRQNTMMDAFLVAREGFSAAGWDAFAAQRADVQAKNTYTSIATQAMTWVPLLHNVLTIVFYAMFVVVFPLFLFPRTGPTTLKGYLTGFFYLSAWGPLYCLLHMFVMNRAASSMAALAPEGPTLMLVDGIQSVNNDIATVAGFLMMSVPFLAAGIARGAMALAGQATSMLQPAQGAAEAAAVERTTGNYAYGNTSFANLTANTRQANKWDTTPLFASGVPSWASTGSDGTVTRGWADGSTSYDAGQAMGKLPFGISLRNAVTSSLSSIEERAQGVRFSASQGFGSGRTATDATFSSRTRTNSSTEGSETSSGTQSGTTAERFTTYDKGTAQRYELSETDTKRTNLARGRTKREGTEEREADTGTWTAGGTASADITGSTPGGGGIGPLRIPEISGRAGIKGGYDRNWADQDSEYSGDETTSSSERSKSEESVDRRTGSSDWQDREGTRDVASSGTYARAGDFTRDERTTADTTGTEDRLVVSQDEFKRQELARTQEEAARTLRQRVQSGEVAVTGDISRAVAARYEEERMSDPNGLLPPVWSSNLSPEEYALRDKRLQEIAAEYVRPMVEARLASGDHTSPIDLGGPQPKDFGPMPTPDRPSLSLREGDASDSALASLGQRPRGDQDSDFNPIGQARHLGLRIKPETRISGLDDRMEPVLPAVSAASRALGISSRTITSGNDREHMRNSRHYIDQAVDIKANDITPAQGRRLAASIQSRLGSGFRILYEHDPEDPENRHIHIQTTGRRR